MWNLNKLLPLILLLGIAGCGKDNPPPGSSAENCYSGEIVKRISNQKGIVWYDSVGKTYLVRVHQEGSIDAVDIGFICEAAKIPKKDGEKIMLSGNFYSYAGSRKPVLVGEKYYNLDITSFDKVPD